MGTDSRSDANPTGTHRRTPGARQGSCRYGHTATTSQRPHTHDQSDDNVSGHGRQGGQDESGKEYPRTATRRS